MEKRLPFHQQLKRERERRNWSQEDVASKLGYDTKTVARWESGERFPRPYHRQAICELFGKSAEEFGLLAEGEESLKEREPPVEDVIPPNPATIGSERQDISHISYQEPPPVGTTLLTYDIHSSWVVAIAWEPHGKRIVSAGGDGAVRVWDAETGKNLCTYRRHTRRLAKANLQPTVYNVAWSPDRKRIASAGDGTEVYVWDPNSGQTLSVYHGHSGFLSNVFAIAWSPDSTHVASACSTIGLDKTVQLWNVATGNTVRRYQVQSGLLPNFSVLAVDWSPDGKRIAGACDGKTIQVWDVETGRRVLTCTSRSPWVSDIAWSPDGTRIAAANSDHTAQIWNARTGELLLTYGGHSDGVRALAWSPDGRYIASASNDKTVQIWDPTTGESTFTYREHSNWATSVAWSPDGTRIASASNDKTVKIWQAKEVAIQVA